MYDKSCEKLCGTAEELNRGCASNLLNSSTQSVKPRDRAKRSLPRDEVEPLSWESQHLTTTVLRGAKLECSILPQFSIFILQHFCRLAMTWDIDSANYRWPHCCTKNVLVLPHQMFGGNINLLSKCIHCLQCVLFVKSTFLFVKMTNVGV